MFAPVRAAGREGYAFAQDSDERQLIPTVGMERSSEGTAGVAVNAAGETSKIEKPRCRSQGERPPRYNAPEPDGRMRAATIPAAA